ncbi:MAG: CaiB/BaiF CoA-transferase family protein [Alphaproteobacteria bacterium]|nr:CaiB/BaiF CoA-transferase family protein [Alphaproteobacteria bacterium]
MNESPESAGPLSGLTVIDMTRVLAGPYCTMLLRDLGARVIKVEVPETGDDSRSFGPFIEGVSAYFLSLNRGKESIALNLKNERDRAIFDALIRQSDVLVENYRAGAMERLGYGWDALQAANPRLIYAAISGFGQTGPYKSRPAYDMVVQGMGGIMSVTGQPDGPPTRVGTSVGDLTAGLFALSAINAALYQRERTGLGRMIDISMLDCQVAILENAIARYAVTGQAPGPLGARHPSITPFEAYATQDGHIIIAAGNDKLFRILAAALDRPDLANDPRFLANAQRAAHVEELKAELERTLTTAPTAHWLAVLDDAGVPNGPINNVAQALNDPQIRARNMVVEMHDPDGPNLTMAGNPIKMSGIADPDRRPPAPKLDADRARILAELGIED